jgi:hypothetical protein
MVIMTEIFCSFSHSLDANSGILTQLLAFWTLCIVPFLADFPYFEKMATIRGFLPSRWLATIGNFYRAVA